MKKLILHLFISTTVLLILSACNDNKKAVELQIEKAQALYENAQYNSAKQVLDGLKEQYPKEIGVQKKRLHLMRLIELKEQERNLCFCDSLLPLRQAEVDSLKKYFIFEKDPEYDVTGRYIEKKLAASPASMNIQAGVNEAGDLYLKSLYAGTLPITHNQLKVSVPSGEYAITEAVAFDGGANYSFKDDNTGLIHETVTYQQKRDNGVALFICSHSGEKLTAQYLGGKTYLHVLTRQEKESLVKSTELSSAILDLQKIQTEKTKADNRIKYLKSKISSYN